MECGLLVETFGFLAESGIAGLLEIVRFRSAEYLLFLDS